MTVGARRRQDDDRYSAARNREAVDEGQGPDAKKARDRALAGTLEGAVAWMARQDELARNRLAHGRLQQPATEVQQ